MPPVKMTITLSIEPETWRSFQQACRQRDCYPSHEVQRLMQEQLATWQARTSPGAGTPPRRQKKGFSS